MELQYQSPEIINKNTIKLLKFLKVVQIAEDHDCVNVIFLFSIYLDQ